MSIQAIEYFFLNTWLWGMTWGIYHIPINMLVMLVLLKFVGRLKIVPSVLLAFFSKVFASALYTLIVFFLVFVVKLQFVPKIDLVDSDSINVLLACICLGIVYSVFQALFFLMVNKFYALNIRLTTLIAFVSNIITALLVYRFVEII